MAKVKQIIQTGKKEPMISIEGARSHPMLKKQNIGTITIFILVRFIIWDHPVFAFSLREVSCATDFQLRTRD
jgi:hypothetical protein